MVDVSVSLIERQAAFIDSLLGQAVRAVRKAKGIQQKDLAAALQVSPARVSQLESGDGWSLHTAARVAALVGEPLAVLLGGHVLSDDEEAVVLAMRRGDLLAAVRVVVGGRPRE